MKFQEIMLKNLKLIEILVYNNAPSPSSGTGPAHGQKATSPSKSSTNAPVLILHYCPNLDKPSFVLHHSFKSTNLRFFNNIAVAIKNDEEKVGE